MNSTENNLNDLQNLNLNCIKNTLNTEINPSLVKLFIEDNNLNCNFFTNNNFNKLQNDIIEEVYKQSNGQYQIGYQDQDQLIIVMRSMYLMYSNNLPYDINEQVNQLNKSVLEYCVPNILNNVLQYIGYIKDRESVPFIPNPVNDNLYIPLESNNIN
jgi:hypothetical protein